MIEKIGPIKNPLTIIAIFAGIAEISGTIVLPFINEQHQQLYIWFLMIFPTILIIAFFVTLNFNHKVLYAPSDYKDEDNFIKLLHKANLTEKIEKISSEVQYDVDSFSTVSITAPDPSNPIVEEASVFKKLVKRSSQATHFLAREMIFEKMATEFSSEIQKGVRPIGIKEGFIFDGVVSDMSGMTIIEIKLLRNNRIIGIQDTINRIVGTLNLIPRDKRTNIKIILAIVFDSDNPIKDKTKHKLEQITKTISIPIIFRYYNLTDLENEFYKDNPTETGKA